MQNNNNPGQSIIHKTKATSFVVKDSVGSIVPIARPVPIHTEQAKYKAKIIIVYFENE